MKEAAKWIVLCVHGYGVRSTFWSVFEQQLAPMVQSIISPIIDWLDFATNQAQLTAILESLQTRQPHKLLLVGHSLGGIIAAKIASEHPNLVDGLVVISSPYSLITETENSNGKNNDISPVLRFLFQKGVLPRWIIRRRFFGKAVAKKLRKQFFLQTVREDPIVKNFVMQRPWFHCADFIRALTVPALFLASKADKIVPWMQTQAFAGVCQAKFALLEQAPAIGHDDLAVMPQTAAYIAALIQQSFLIEKPY